MDAINSWFEVVGVGDRIIAFSSLDSGSAIAPFK
jgi:hypothetical protein